MARKPRIPHVKWRNGKPRFEPGPGLRALGFTGRDLLHEDGRWFTAGEALDFSQDISAEIDKRRREARTATAVAPARRGPKAPVRLYSIAMLFEDFFSPAKNPKMAATQTTVGKRRARVLSPSTITDYRQKARVLESHDWDLWHSSVDALDETICYGLYESLWSARGLATAVGTMRVLSAAISWGRRRGRVHLVSNPASNLQMQMPEPRVRVGEREEIHALIAVADALGRHDAGDMIALGLWTGQRQADRIALTGLNAELVHGRRRFRQQKTGAIVVIKEAPMLEARLAATRERRKAAEVADPHVTLNEQTWQPWDRHYWGHLYAALRSVTAAGLYRLPDGRFASEGMGDARQHRYMLPGVALPETSAAPARGARSAGAGHGTNEPDWIVPPLPSVRTLRDQDLRDTCVTWMAMGGSEVPEIISVTGHSPQSATQVLRHYLAQRPEMADSAIDKMVTWYESGEESGI